MNDLDFSADRMMRKLQTSSCEQLKAQKNAPPTDQPKEASEYLRNATHTRAACVNKVLAPVLNRMLESVRAPRDSRCARSVRAQ